MEREITDIWVELFKTLGFKNVFIQKDQTEIRISGKKTMTEQEVQILSDQIAQLGEEISQENIDLSQYDLELTSGANIMWGKLGHPYFKKIILPILAKAEYSRGRSLSFDKLIELFNIACCYLRTFAMASKMPQLSFIQHYLQFDRKKAEGYSLCRARADCEVMKYWFDRVSKEEKDAIVDLMFNDWWAADYTRFYDESDNPPTIRITSCLGTQGAPVGRRRDEIAYMDGILQRLMTPFMDNPRLTFRLDAYGTRLHDLGEDYLSVLFPIAADMGTTVSSIELKEPGVTRSAFIDFSNTFGVEMHTESLMPRISYFLPWFHGSRLGEFETPEAFGKAARGDFARAEKVRNWMDKTNNGRVRSLMFDEFHVSYGMDDQRLDILLAALEPHVNAINRTEYETFHRVWIYLEPPDKQIWKEENTLKICMPHLKNEDIQAFLDNWFITNPIPEPYNLT